MAKTKQSDFHYKIFSLRLSEETKESLKLQKDKSGKSWNLFIIELLKKYGDEAMCLRKQ